MGFNVFTTIIPLCFAPLPACVASTSTPDAAEEANTAVKKEKDPACTGNSTTAITAQDVLTEIRWGGLLSFRKEMDQEEHSPILLTVANDEWISYRMPRHPSQKPCTLDAARCLWVFRALDWKPPADKFRTDKKNTLITVVLRPDGPLLENADVRVYADGCKRIYAVSAWRPPYNMDNARIMLDINWEDGIPVACQKFEPGVKK